MVKRSLTYFFYCLFAISFLSACKSKDKPSGPDYTLKMQLKEGDKFNHDLNVSIGTDMSMSGQNVGMTMDMDMGISFEVLSDSANYKRLRLTYDRSKTTVDIKGLPEGSMDTDAMNKSDSKIQGKSIILVLGKGNEIVEVTGFDQMMEGDELTTLQEKEAYKKMFSKDQINSMMGLMFMMYPDKPVKVGETWEKLNEVTIAGIKMKMNNKFKLLSVNNGVAVIDINSKYKGKGELSQGGMELEMDMAGEQTGKMSIRVNDGYLDNADYRVNIDAEAKIMGQKVPYKVKGRTTMKGK